MTGRSFTTLDRYAGIVCALLHGPQTLRQIRTKMGMREATREDALYHFVESLHIKGAVYISGFQPVPTGGYSAVFALQPSLGRYSDATKPRHVVLPGAAPMVVGVRQVA